MGYVDTVAHHTASAASSAGDPTWIRNANTDVAQLGFIEAIPAIIGTLAQVGSSVYQITEQRKDAKDAKGQADAAQRAAASQAAKVLAEQHRVNDAQLSLAQQQVTSDVKIAGATKPVLTYAIAGGVVLLGLGAFFWMRRRGGRK